MSETRRLKKKGNVQNAQLSICFTDFSKKWNSFAGWESVSLQSYRTIRPIIWG